MSRVSSGLGVLLAVFAGFHLFQQWPALASREEWIDRTRELGLGPWLVAALCVALALYAVLVVRAWLAARGAGRVEPLSGAHLVTGGLLFAFLVFHVLQVWPSSGPHSSVFDVYQRLWESLGQPLVLLGYVVGVTALAFHLALGVVRFAQRRGGDARLARYAAGAVALLLWLGYLQVLGRFAIGEGLIPTASDKRGSSHASERDGNDRDH